MELFKFEFDNKTLIIIITSIIWTMNFRSSFKNIDSHMDSGSYCSLKFDLQVVLFKNILSCFFIIGFLYERRLSKLSEIKEKNIIRIDKGSMVVFEMKEITTDKDKVFGSIVVLNQLKNKKQEIYFWIKSFFLIVIVYFIEEMYFIIANNHILDRLICPLRNLGVLITLLIFSPLLIKNTWRLYRHQLVPLIIIFILSILIIVYNMLNIDRFSKIFKINFIFYLCSFILIGIEMVLVKYLIDCLFINIFIILTVKGFLGTFIFSIINIIYNRKQFFDFFDKILYFEYEEMYEEFGVGQKIFYVSSTIILQYLKYFIINRFTENHLLSVLMITDIIYFPLYCMERFWVQKFNISTKSTFYFNTLLGFINSFLMLIFNEILECKFWGLDTNIKKNIHERQNEETRISNSVNYEDENCETEE